ncbi:MAG: hypothetical protein GXX01_01475 [Clostridiales bacterium]|nr:hypothetical protein [Clostridiales bacterium]
MTRLERSRLRKRRARIRCLMLLACLLLFFAGVYKTYYTMQTVLGLETNESILSFKNTGQALREAAGDFPSLKNRIQEAINSLFSQIHCLLEFLRRRLLSLINMSK